MFQQNGTYYTEEHSVTFGDLITRTSGGVTYTAFNAVANTWTDWHLIPSSRPSIVPAPVTTKFVAIPGSDTIIDFTDYLTGRPTYGQRQGSLSFIVDNDHEYFESIRENMMRVLHGKRLKMVLQDDPSYYYEGRFSIASFESGASNTTVQISYQLDPYKLKINENGSELQLWDPFNFDKDYDYALLQDSITINDETKNIIIHANDYPFAPTIYSSTGGVTARFGGKTVTPAAGESAVLGVAIAGNNTLKLTGTGTVSIKWRGGSL